MQKAIIFIFALVSFGFVFGQNQAYETAMSSTIEEWKAAEEVADYQEVVNKFERIGQLANKEWLPKYYEAFIHVSLTWKAMASEDNKAVTNHIEKADELIRIAKKLSPNNSEILVLEAHLYQVKISKSPMLNGPRYSSTVMSLLSQAIELNPNNPRANYIMGQQFLNMPSFLGGGLEKAMPQFEAAEAKFATFEAVSCLYPDWGKESNSNVLDKLRERVGTN